ncbi:MAG: hypothetical protein WBA39_02115 [Rivularia sp. (in: cyanobacteria)]
MSNTYTSTAIKSSLEYVDCLQVKSPGDGVLIWSEPTGKSKFLRVIGNGETVKYGSFPATIIDDGTEGGVASLLELLINKQDIVDRFPFCF